MIAKVAHGRFKVARNTDTGHLLFFKPGPDVTDYKTCSNTDSCLVSSTEQWAPGTNIELTVQGQGPDGGDSFEREYTIE